ncbi:DUF2326 domain-containing protein [Alloscardovia theropitheci]|uniref:DUF2326 domain-containing protein n=1 Tax=Alloscardovia theropitheci TaxID=2496842 RepID=UPI0013F145C8|nr:DUF2326 domain-containing protein [Alloscardovia theropitheci]
MILGDESGENSIGKSSLLLALDFVFGGNTYIGSEADKHIGTHDVCFTFRFNGVDYHFLRNTNNPKKVYITDSRWNRTGDVWECGDFTHWLSAKYNIDFLGLTFRTAVSLYSRIYGKQNLDEHDPLKGHSAETKRDSVFRLIKTFDEFSKIDMYSKEFEKFRQELSVFNNARKYEFIASDVKNKTRYEANRIEIGRLEEKLLSLQNSQPREYDKYEVDVKSKVIDLKNQKTILDNQISNLYRKKRLVDLSLSYGLLPRVSDLNALQEFFPNVNLRKIYEVENYHQKLSKILQENFKQDQESIQEQITALEEISRKFASQINELGLHSDVPLEFAQAYNEITSRIKSLQAQNDAYAKARELKDKKKQSLTNLNDAVTSILNRIQNSANMKMSEFNRQIFQGERRNSPELNLRTSSNYTFYTPEDNGTGTNYKGLILYDLAILELTNIPIIMHDSLLFKNISDEAIQGIMELYSKAKKQIFIAFDKQNSYGEEVHRILHDNTVIQLAGNGEELYGEAWNRKR